MSLKSYIVGQFRKPTGLLGALAGRIMANRPSNRQRNAATVALMDLVSDSRVLEIGCGPGLALELCTGIVTGGRIVGLDHSATMIRQAEKRIKKAGHRGRVEFFLGGAERLAQWTDAFDRVYSLNVVQFIADKPALFAAIRAALAPGGRVFTTYQPRVSNDPTAASAEMALRLEAVLNEAGFVGIERHDIAVEGEPAFCISARKPDPEAG